MEQEEIRQKVMLDEVSPVVRSALAASGGANLDDRECYNCGKRGHLSYNCTQPRNYDRGGRIGGRGRRGGRRGRGGRNPAGNRGAAHLAVAEDQGVVEMKRAEAAELEELRQFKKQAESSQTRGIDSQDTTDHSFGNFVGYAHTDSGNKAQALSSTKSNIRWIIDSGASRHVTGEMSEFVSYFPNQHKYLDTIQTTDGTSQPITGVGSVRCTSTITLPSVLHVPSFPVNLLSVSSIIDQLNCVVSFDHVGCYFQEKETGKRLGTGVRHDGLWYLD